MKFIICINLFFVFDILAALQVFGQVDTFTVRFPGTGHGNAVALTRDSGFIVAGDNFFLARFSKNNDTLWVRYFQNQNLTYANSVQQTTDNGFIAVGDGWNSKSIISILKVDSSGNLQWAETIGDNNDLNGKSVIQCSNGNYLISGSAGNGLYLCQVNPLGNLLWSKKYGTANYYRGYGARETNDKGFIAIGSNDYVSSEPLILIKTDSLGNIIWEKNLFFGGAYFNSPSFSTTSDNGIAIAAFAYDAYFTYFILIKTDSSGNVQFARKYSLNANTAASFVIQTKEKNYLIGNGGGDYMTASQIILTDSLGYIIWAYDGYGQGLTSVQQTYDSGFIFSSSACYFDLFYFGYSDITVVKLNNNGNGTCYLSQNTWVTTDTISITSTTASLSISSGGTASSFTPAAVTIDTIIFPCQPYTMPCFEGIEKQSGKILDIVSVYPNPFHLQTNMHLNREFSKISLSVYNIMGEMLKSFEFFNASEITLNRDGMENGIYFYEINDYKSSKIRGILIIY